MKALRLVCPSVGGIGHLLLCLCASPSLFLATVTTFLRTSLSTCPPGSLVFTAPGVQAPPQTPWPWPCFAVLLRQLPADTTPKCLPKSPQQPPLPPAGPSPQPCRPLQPPPLRAEEMGSLCRHLHVICIFIAQRTQELKPLPRVCWPPGSHCCEMSLLVFHLLLFF